MDMYVCIEYWSKILHHQKNEEVITEKIKTYKYY